MSTRVLAILHQCDSTPGRVGEFLEMRGYRLERRCPMAGDELPAALDEYAALVVFGGPQSANDEHLPGMRAELDWLERSALPCGRPLLGICLGAQQIARVLGARVGRHERGVVEIGFTDILPTPAGREFLPRPTPFYQWHAETFDIPHGAVHLAGTEAFPNQAFRYEGRVWGLEFHPEITRAMIQRWCSSEDGCAELSRPGAHPHARQLADFDRHSAACEQWLAGFLDRQLLPLAERAV